jgi:TolA-binding protein
MRRRAPGIALLALVLAACAANSASDPAPPSAAPPVAAATPRDSALERRAARLELRLAERDAQVADLQARLDEAREEIVRTLAKLQTVASRAEAASAMAEAEIAVQGLRAAAGTQANGVAEVGQAGTLLQQASTAFGQQNYGGALYLANETKRVAGMGRTRLAGAGSERGSLRPGEVAFAVAVPLQAVARGKIREGPGSTYRVVFTVEPGAVLTGYSYVDQWVRVADESGHAGWMFVTLVGRRG